MIFMLVFFEQSFIDFIYSHYIILLGKYDKLHVEILLLK